MICHAAASDDFSEGGRSRLPFFVIGGYAVMAHGFVRATDDLDLLAQAGPRHDWQRLAESLGMTVYREASTFLQFNPAPGERLPLDLMLVADEVFASFFGGSIGYDFFIVRNCQGNAAGFTAKANLAAKGDSALFARCSI